MVIEPVKSDEVILIVDDVELNRAILSELFQKEYSILEAENGAEAFEQFQGSYEMRGYTFRKEQFVCSFDADGHFLHLSMR